MKKTVLGAVLLLASLVIVQPVLAQSITIRPGENLQQVIEAQKGKRITLRLGGNDELTGTVRNVTKELVHLGEISGREFFDAVIDVNKVSAVIIRVK